MSGAKAVEEVRRPDDIPWYAIEEWSLRRKLALALAIPMLLAATFGGLRVANATSDAQNFSRLESRVSVLKPAVRMVDSAAAAAIAGRGTDDGAVERARTAFDTNVTALRRAMRSAGLTDEQAASLDQALEAAQPLRDASADTPVETLSSQLSDAVGQVTVVLNEFAGATSDTRLTTVRDILAGQVALTEQRLLTTLPKEGTKVDPLALGNAIGEEATAIAALSSTLGAQDTFVDAFASGNELRLSSAQAVADGTTGLARAADTGALYTTLANKINDQVLSAMRAKADDARATAIRDSVATIGLLVAAVLLALAVARMLLEPIKRVRLGALEVASERLPTALEKIRAGQDPDPVTPLPVHTAEEVGQLARAVDVLHTEAIQLATEQARLRGQVSAMFETLSRRSTSLINQQLGLIENLERDEDDPRRLESLFRLDHLAARIRRNGESLLVLAGAAPRGVTGEDLALGDVLRAATSEVQDYQRVELAASDLVVSSAAVPNLVHLFAELIDNALSYSPPDSTVVVAIARGIDGGTLVEVVDNGLGMPLDAMQAANDALITGGEVTTETARRMGLYVVGQLAIRHQVTVRIRQNPESTGTVVSVFLPSSVLASERDALDEPGMPSAADPLADPFAAVDAGTNDGASAVEGAGVTADPAAADRPRVPTLTAVPNLPAAVRPSGPASGHDLIAAWSTMSPTSVPQAEEPAAKAEETPGLPRRRPGATGAGAGNGLGAAPAAPVAPAAPAAGSSPASDDSRAVRPVAPVAAEAGAPSDGPRRVDVPRTDQPAAPTPVAESPVVDERAAETPAAEAPADEAPVVRTATVASLDDARPQRASRGEATAYETAPGAGSRHTDEEPTRLPTRLPKRLPQRQAEPVATEPTRAEPAPEAPAAPVFPTASRDFRSIRDLDPASVSETPIFRQLTSSWLSESGEGDLPWASSAIDEGWQAAERAVVAEPAGVSASGLPMRRPGSTLVPGQAGTSGPAPVARDPEAIRRQLNRHRAGVQRARRQVPTPADAGGSTLLDEEN